MVVNIHLYSIVFVHGLTGGSYTSWLHEENKVHWPSDLLPNDVQDARILAFGYDADVVNIWDRNPASRSRVQNHAENLLGALIGVREETNSVRSRHTIAEPILTRI